MVFGNQHHILRSGTLEQGRPRNRIPEFRFEILGEILVTNILSITGFMEIGYFSVMRFGSQPMPIPFGVG
jgi:hypothetical protein